MGKTKRKKTTISTPAKVLASQRNGKLGGRPPKWDGESLDALADSLDTWLENAIKNKSEFWWWDWCFEVGVNQNKVSLLAQKSDRFRISYENAKAWQESIVARFALTKKFSDGFSKFFLQSQHCSEKWKDKSSESTKREDLIADIEKFFEERKLRASSLSGMAPEQPILHQGRTREEDSLPNELGSD